MFSCFVLFSQCYFGYSASFEVPMNFRIVCYFSVKKNGAGRLRNYIGSVDHSG